MLNNLARAIGLSHRGYSTYGTQLLAWFRVVDVSPEKSVNLIASAEPRHAALFLSHHLAVPETGRIDRRART